MAYVLDPNTGPVSNILSEQIMSQWDVLKPQHIQTLMSRYGDQYFPMFGFFESMGRSQPVQGEYWYGHEENWYWRYITTTGDMADPGAGNVGTITLATDDHDSEGNSFPREGQIISIPGTFVQGQIIDKDTSNPAAHVLTIKPGKATNTLGAISSGTKIAISTIAYASGMGQPEGTIVGTTRRKFYSQIFKETIGAEGTQLVLERWYKVIDDSNKSVVGYYTPGLARMEYNLALQIDGGYTWGDESDNLTQTTHRGHTNTVYTTKGIFPHIRDLGKTLNYTYGSFAIEDLYEIGFYLLSQGITSGYVVLMAGAKFMKDLEKAVYTYISGNGTDLTQRVGEKLFGTTDFALSMGVTAIKIGGIIYIIKPMEQWSNPKTFGLTGYDLDKYAIWAPLSKVKDKKTGKLLDNIATRYLAKGNYSRKFEMWEDGAAGGNTGKYVGEIDEKNWYMRGHHGLQALKVNQWGMYKPL